MRLPSVKVLSVCVCVQCVWWEGGYHALVSPLLNYRNQCEHAETTNELSRCDLQLSALCPD